MEERINRLQLIKSSQEERYEQASFDSLVEKNYQFRRKLILQRFFLKPSNELLGIMVLATLFIFFSRHLLAGESNIGDVAFFLYLVKTSFKPVKKVAQAVGDLNMALISTGKIERLFEEEQERDSGTDSLENTEVESIKVNGLKFGYNGNPLLNGVSFDLFRGDKIVITGESGAGKTTLCSLIVLIREPSRWDEFLLTEEILQPFLPARSKPGPFMSGEIPLMPGT
ncbi:MAG: ATP-binding cassette domain-containing protein [Bacteroidales bacterium]